MRKFPASIFACIADDCLTYFSRRRIWLPQTLRFILRTNTAPCVDGVTQAGKCSAVPAANGGPFVSGEAPTLATMKPNGTVFVKEVRWTPLTASATVVADAKAHNSIGDLCAVRGCADPYAAAGASKAPLPTPPTPTVNPTSPNPYAVSSTLYIDSTYTAATIMAADVQTKLATAIATSVGVAASAVKIVSAKAFTATSRHLLQASNIVEVAFTVTTTAANATEVENALAASWNDAAGQAVVHPTTTVAATTPTPEARLTAAGLTGIADVKLNSAPASVDTTASPTPSSSSSSSSSSPDVSAQVSAEYIVLSVGLLIVMVVGCGAWKQRARDGQKR
jgi:hypothetical protein